MKSLIYFLLIFAIVIPSCTPPKNRYDEIPAEFILSKSDSLLKAFPQNSELINSIIEARLTIAHNNGDLSHYFEVLKLEPNNQIAKYYIFMDEGKKHHEKEFKNGQWEAIQSFSKASAMIDTLGEPHYWIGKSYEKKDAMDFELALEAYDKSLELYLSDKLRTQVIEKRKALIKRKNTYEEFWK